MTRIVSIGECMVEMTPSEREGDYRMSFAGDTMNTAWYLRQLLPSTDQVDYLTAVGDDGISDQMVAFLEGSGIGVAHVSRRPGLTVGLYMVQLKDGERSFSYWRGQSAARTLAQDDATLILALSGAQVAYFSGITLAILPSDDRRRLLDRLGAFREAGGATVFDPNLRPRLWETVAQMTSTVMQAAAVSETVLPSYEDEAEFFGDADPGETAWRYAQGGARTVIVKDGPRSILASDHGRLTHHAPALVASVVDTTAAGDSFNAGFLASRIRGETIEQSVAAAAVLAAKVVQARGALVSGIRQKA